MAIDSTRENTCAADVLDGLRLREVMGHYPTGVVVVTGLTADGEILAMVVGTFSSVSLDPPLVSFMPMRTSRTFDRLRECETLCINVMGGGEEEVVATIARRWENKLDGIGWKPAPSGAPVLDASIAWLEASMSQIIEAGDHWIVLCEVHEVEVNDPVPPLIFLQGG
ncbi:flavin reductase family protein [Tsukamurella asaccharolytica]|uniref:flavin reductase family protein n=1 Tax=Tsukamurella asaccharolytica TaxID=2592067 RepID=UPI001E4A6E20|nr:flavin reductase family protein [Tsukamurella asaccharolytica]